MFHHFACGTYMAETGEVGAVALVYTYLRFILSHCPLHTAAITSAVILTIIQCEKSFMINYSWNLHDSQRPEK